MTDNNTPQRTDRVPGFVYLDMDRVRSISSRLDEGYIEEKVEEREESEEVAKGITTSIRATIFGVVPGTVSGEMEGNYEKTDHSGTVTGENRALHHYYFTLLEEWLEGFEGGWFHDVESIEEGLEGRSYGKDALPSKVRDEISEGDIIRVSGDLQLMDFGASMDFIEGMLSSKTHIEDFESRASNHSSQEGVDSDDISELNKELDMIRMFKPMVDMMSNVIPDSYEDLLTAEINPYVDSEENF